MIINTTPHDVVVFVRNDVVRFPKSCKPARLTVTTIRDEPIMGIPTCKVEFGEAIDLPSPKEGTWFIVSQIIKSALPLRTDLLVPAEIVRDENGNVVGCRGFQL